MYAVLAGILSWCGIQCLQLLVGKGVSAQPSLSALPAGVVSQCSSQWVPCLLG